MKLRVQMQRWHTIPWLRRLQSLSKKMVRLKLSLHTWTKMHRTKSLTIRWNHLKNLSSIQKNTLFLQKNSISQATSWLTMILNWQTSMVIQTLIHMRMVQLTMNQKTWIRRQWNQALNWFTKYGWIQHNLAQPTLKIFKQSASQITMMKPSWMWTQSRFTIVWQVQTLLLSLISQTLVAWLQRPLKLASRNH